MENFLLPFDCIRFQLFNTFCLWRSYSYNSLRMQNIWLTRMCIVRDSCAKLVLHAHNRKSWNAFKISTRTKCNCIQFRTTVCNGVENLKLEMAMTTFELGRTSFAFSSFPIPSHCFVNRNTALMCLWHVVHNVYNFVYTTIHAHKCRYTTRK